MKRAIIVYSSMSGNTKEVAELIGDVLRDHGLLEVAEYDIGLYETGHYSLPSLSMYDEVFFGTYTWDHGSTPAEVKDFIADIGYKPDNVHVFGTGDTQFGGDDLFCRAAKKLSVFYHTEVNPLIIEQSPRGTQESDVINWTESIIKRREHNERATNEITRTESEVSE